MPENDEDIIGEEEDLPMQSENEQQQQENISEPGEDD